MRILKIYFLLRMTLLCMILLLDSCSKPGRKEASGLVYIFLEKPSSYPDLFNKYSELDIAEFIKKHPVEHPSTDTLFVTEFYVMEAFDDFLPGGTDSVMLAFLSFGDEGEDQVTGGDSILGEAFQIRESKGVLSIIERKYFTTADIEQEPAAEGTEADVMAIEEDAEPVYRLNIFPEGGGALDPLDKYYDAVTAMEVFDLIYYDKYIPEQYTEDATLSDLVVTEASLVSVLGIGEKNYNDSLIIVFMSYVPGDEEYYEDEYEAVTHNELYVIELADGQLYEQVSWDMGELYESASGSYFTGSIYEFELFPVSEWASLIAIYNSHEDGSEYEGVSTEEVSLYAIEGGDLSLVLHLELGSSRWEADYQGPPEEQYSRSEVTEGQLSVTDELYEGFCKLGFRQTYKEIENGEVIQQWEETTYYVWTGTMYSLQDDPH